MHYKIVDDTLEVEQTLSEIHPLSKTNFRKHVQTIVERCTNCTKYYLLIKNSTGIVILSEMHSIEV